MTARFKFLAFMLVLAILINKSQAICGDYCYSKDSSFGSCKICFSQCTRNNQIFFLSCHIQSGQNSQFQKLSEDQCHQLCQPEDFIGLDGKTDLQLKTASPEGSFQIEETDIETNLNENTQEETTDTQIQFQTPLAPQLGTEDAQQVDQRQKTNLQKEDQNEDSEQLPLTFEELEELKRNTENWASPQQRIFKVCGILLACSLLIIVAFTQIWRYIDKKRKLEELKQNQQKEWAKCFQKVQISDTTICTTEAKDEQVASTQA